MVFYYCSSYSLRPLDMEFMKHLSKVVNIIPVIAKADTMTLEEKIEFKQRVSLSPWRHLFLRAFGVMAEIVCPFAAFHFEMLFLPRFAKS